eukprot:jgi/Bigna1/88111/estExt_fgenesh1_pg.C_280088
MFLIRVPKMRAEEPAPARSLWMVLLSDKLACICFHAGNRTPILGVKIPYPNRWTTRKGDGMSLVRKLHRNYAFTALARSRKQKNRTPINLPWNGTSGVLSEYNITKKDEGDFRRETAVSLKFSETVSNISIKRSKLPVRETVNVNFVRAMHQSSRDVEDECDAYLLMMRSLLTSATRSLQSGKLFAKSLSTKSSLRQRGSLFFRNPRNRIRCAVMATGAAVGAAGALAITVPQCAGGGVGFINSPENIVVEAIEGLVQSHSHLCRLDGYPETAAKTHISFVVPLTHLRSSSFCFLTALPPKVKVVLRSDWVSPKNAHKVLAAIRSVGYPGGEEQKKKKERSLFLGCLDENDDADDDNDGVRVERVVAGPLMTSMDMAGFSISLLKLPSAKSERERMLYRLDSDTNAPGWPRGGGERPMWACTPLSKAITVPQCAGGGVGFINSPENIVVEAIEGLVQSHSHLCRLDGYPETAAKTHISFVVPLTHLRSSSFCFLTALPPKVKVVLRSDWVSPKNAHKVAQSLKEAEESLTEWDLKVGDGDCGATFKRGAEAALADMDGYPLNSIPDTLESIAKSVARSMGGTSGALYQIFLLSLCATTRQQEKKEGADSSSSLSHLAFAFDEAISKIASSGGATEGDRTMLDALIPASRSLQQSSQLERELLPALELAVLAAECGAEATKEMDARAGRSNYVPEAVLRQTPDPGAKVTVAVARGMHLGANNATETVEEGKF